MADLFPSIHTDDLTQIGWADENSKSVPLVEINYTKVNLRETALLIERIERTRTYNDRVKRGLVAAA